MNWKWQKRECPIVMKLIRDDVDVNVEININGDLLRYQVDGLWVGQLWGFVHNLWWVNPMHRITYQLFTGRINDDGLLFVEEDPDGICLYSSRVRDGEVYDHETREVKFDKEGALSNCTANLTLEDERTGVDVTITRPFNVEEEFDITIEFKEWEREWGEDGNDKIMTKNVFSYTVPYADFCYAVGKAFTEFLKTYGFMTVERTVFDVSVYKLCYVKACGMRCPRFCRWVYDYGGSLKRPSIERPSFEDEMELLNFDM